MQHNHLDVIFCGLYCYNPVTCEKLKGYKNEPVYTGVTYKDNSGKNVHFRYLILNFFYNTLVELFRKIEKMYTIITNPL